MDNIVTIDQTLRNRMSVMAWGMTALCAWVIILAAHGFDACAKCVPYPVTEPVTTSHEPTVITSSRHP